MQEKIQLIINSIENQLNLLKLELNEGSLPPPQDNTIKLTDLIQVPENNEEPEYYEEPDDSPDLLLNNQNEQEFYKSFKL
jgi:hypothetical protein